MREGRSLADTLREHEEVIPALVTQMVEVGEQTGALDAMLHKVGEFYDGEVETTVNNLTVDARADPDRGHGCGRRRHGDQHVPADVQLHQSRPDALSRSSSARP